MATTIRNAYQMSAFQAAPTGNDGWLGRVAGRLNRTAMAVVAIYFEWSERSAQRRRLAALDDRLLDDIGIDRGAAAREAGKFFWQA